MQTFEYKCKCVVSWTAFVLLVAGCNTDKIADAIDGLDTDKLDAVTADLAKQCGLSCPKEGVLEGNAAISGVAAVDGFFAAVVNYQTTADHVSGGIEAQLDAIKADFGFAADVDLVVELDKKIGTYCEGTIAVVAEPIKCVTDVQTVLRAQASCDVSVKPASAMVECKGSCAVEASASASCDGGAELKCVSACPSIACDGKCQGGCTATLAAAAACDGSCQGTCSGECSAYVQNAAGDFECAGTCAGTCTGSCTTELAVATECSGICDGQCTVINPAGGCAGSIKASCQATASTSVMCSSRCEGDFEAPTAKAECKASAQAQAKVNVECTPPRLAMHYKLITVASAEVEAQLRFMTALNKLELRLPALLASIEKAKSVAAAGELLAVSASGAVKVSFQKVTTGELSIKETIGLGCAIKALGDVDEAITTPEERLMLNLMVSGDLQASLGLES